MKKFLAILLVVCMLFTVSVFAAETTFVDMFTIFDFGSDSRLDDTFKVNLLSAIKKYNCIMEENADSWTLTAIGVENFLEQTIVNPTAISGIGAEKIDHITYGVYRINNGWGTYPAKAYTASQGFIYDTSADWQGKNQFMKIRIKNMTDNTKISIMSATSVGSMGSNNSMIFDISANDTEFQIYVVDLALAAGRGFHKGMIERVVPNAYSSSNYTPWVGTGNKHPNTNTVILHPFGSASEGCSVEENTWHNIKDGDTVEIDYMIFAATADMAAEYKSIDEGFDPSQTTTTEATTTTTAKVETTTTTAKVEETSTTPSVSETTTVADGTTTVADETTTVADETTTVADETTTVADETTTVADETTTVADGTTTVADGTTTVADGTTTTVTESDDKEGGFPVWLVICFIVGLGAGAGVTLLCKKK